MPMKIMLFISLFPLLSYGIGNDSTNTKDSTFSKLRFRATADGQYATGNVNRLLMVYKTFFDIRYKKILDLSSNESYSYGRTNNLLAENDWYLNFSGTYLHNGKPTILLFSSIEGSHLRFIDHRFQIGIGPSVNILDSISSHLNINDVLLYDNTEFYYNENHYSTIRNSTRIKGYHRLIKKKLLLIHETFIQPSILDINNFRFKTNISMELPIDKHISLKFTIIESYDSIVYPSKKNNDFQATFGIAFNNL